MVVHRPPDSRLLTNLITHEKEYTKHFASLFPLSHAALASLSAYSAASPSENPYSSTSGSPAQVLAAIVDVLAGADDALQRYLHVVEKWREHLASLKELEDDVSAILRDREILVTRVIKLSKAQKSGRDSRSSFILHPGGSSASFSSLPSTANSVTIGSAGSKLAHAQAELQGCENHLAEKERELAARRISVVREGLGARCRALVDCGWVWGEMGKQGLRALQSLSGGLSESRDTAVAFPRTHSPSPPRSPGYQRLDPSSANALQAPISHASDLSSLTPSQSASQRASTSVEPGQDERNTPDQIESSPAGPKAAEEDIFYQGHVTVSIPPAHAISELVLPTGVPTQRPVSPTPAASASTVSASQSSAPSHVTNTKQDAHAPGTGLRYTRSRQRRPISRHISEASDEDGLEDQIAGEVPPSVALPMSGPSRTGSDTNVPNAVMMQRSDSSDEFPRGPLEVVENEPFASVRSKSSSLRPPTTGGDRDETPSPELRRGKLRERKTSTTFLSSLRGLFSHRGRNKGAGGPSAVWEGPLTAEPTSFKSSGGWSTRIDGHLRGGRNSTDSEAGPKSSIRQSLTGVSPKSKLRKVRGQSMVKSSSSPGSPQAHAAANGWVTDGGNAQGRARGKSKRRKKSIAALKGPDGGFTDGELDNETERGLYGGRSYSAQAGRPSLGKSNASDAASSKRTRRATADLNEMNSVVLNGNSLDTNVRTPRPGHLSPGLPGSLSAQAESHSIPSSQRVSTEVQAHPSSLTPRATSPGRRGAKSGTLHTPNGSADQSLMSIVEDVARQNRERNIASALASLNGHASLSSGNLPMLEVPRAPTLQVPQTFSTGPGASARGELGQQVPNGRARSLDLQRPELVSSTSRVHATLIAASSKLRSAPSSEVKGTPPASSVAGSNSTNPSTSSQLAKTPLRSALRNASRTPSPNPVTFTKPVLPSQEQNARINESNQARELSLERVLSASRGSSVPDLRDSMSISSYETGRESPMGSPSSPSPTLLPPLSPPPQSYVSSHVPLSPPLLRGQVSRDQSGGGASSTASTETPPPARRKSVRMSLQPTFSPPPPPAVYDQFDDGEAVDAWSGRPVDGWNTRTGSHAAAVPTDVWQDSSDEDEEYSRARQLLSRVTKGKGKV